jgi:hypothetical protein
MYLEFLLIALWKEMMIPTPTRRLRKSNNWVQVGRGKDSRKELTNPEIKV